MEAAPRSVRGVRRDQRQMKIEQLEQVVKIAECNSISLAAEHMFISQPNLSMSIKKLEKELGFPIFSRTNKGVETTPLGQSFVESARMILLQLDQLQKMGSKSTQKGLRTFTLAHMHYRYVNHAVAELFAQHEEPNMRFKIFEGARNSVLDMVEARQAELGIIGIFSHYHKITIRQLETKGLQYFRLCSSPVSISVGPGSPLYNSRAEEISIDEISSFPIVIYDEAEPEPYTSILDALGIDSPGKRIIVSERATVGDILDKTDAISITTTSQIAYSNTDYYPTMRHFKVKNCPISGEVGWVKRADMPLSELSLEFLQILSSYFTVLGGELPL